MCLKLTFFVCLFQIGVINFVDGSWEQQAQNNALNNSLYDEVLDTELCHEQIRYIRSNSLLRIMFADAGIRVPRAILQGNNIDLGNYHQCLGINVPLEKYTLEGKYCMIRVPMRQSFEFPDWPFTEYADFNPRLLALDNETLSQFEETRDFNLQRRALTGHFESDRIASEGILAGTTFRLAVCIPKPCTTQQAIASLLFNITAWGFDYTDEFCRLPNDKPWVTGDYVLIAVFAFIGLLTIISTTYDIWHSFYMKRDPEAASVVGKSFSLFTNGRRLTSFSSGAGSLDCLDGIRSISMAWIILGHCFTTEPFFLNIFDAWQWQRTYGALWVTGGTFAVDTFFMMSGLLIVYTTIGKLSSYGLLTNLHLFYLHRLLRVFPIVAIAVLLEATYLNRMTDGPVWGTIANTVQNCRANWWATVLHIQNYATPRALCIIQSWYLAIDTQLHILSPLVLVFVLSGKRKLAGAALVTALLGIMVSTTTYNFIKRFPSNMGAPGRGQDALMYLYDYYMNTFTRAPPFVVGMVFGYLIHLGRQAKIQMSVVQVTVLWVFNFALSMFLMYTNYPIIQMDWNNQTLDSMFNSFTRPAWALCLGLMVFACVTGYGGPVNWFLSLKIFKLPARISYAMYLLHVMLMYAVNHAGVAPVRFTIASVVFKYLAHYVLTFAVSFLITLTVDSPFSTLFKLILRPGPKKLPPKNIVADEVTKEDSKQV